MFKQTVLKFQGALGLLGFGHKDDQEDGDSGNSTPTWFSDENDGNSDTYLTTGVLAPHGQPVSEIKVSRLSTNTIRALIDAYKAKRKNLS